jgi:hypothetical protein
MDTNHTSQLPVVIPQGLTLPANLTNCRACKESIEFIKERIKNDEHFMFAVTYESGTIHYHALISPVQVEKLNKEFQILK